MARPPVRVRRADARFLPALEVARSVPIDAAYLERIVERLSTIGSSPLGFRVAGTPEDEEVAAFVADELDGLGLAGVAVERVELDGWRFHRARLAVDGATYECASFGGAPPTPASGVAAPLVDARDGARPALDRIDVDGRIALVDWTSKAIAPSDLGLELGLRGAVGVVLSCPEGGPCYQTPGSLGSFNSAWHAGAPPLLTIRREDAATLRQRLGAVAVDATLELSATVSPGADGCNVVGYLGNAPRERSLVVGAHHDGWFRGAFDNATGVAAMLAIARGLAEVGHAPQHAICFTSRTAEEYGVLDNHYDWCIGAWRQIAVTHPEWASGSPFHLCLEASGHRTLKASIETPPELRRWARGAARLAEREGWLTTGWGLGSPGTGTEQWPFLTSGVPSLCGITWGTSFARTDYHTQFDTPELVDVAHLERLVRFYTLLVVDADRDPDGILDHAARGRELAREARTLGAVADGLRAAATAHETARGRRAFTAVGRGLFAVTATGSTAYPHTQAARDLARLREALRALAAGDRRAAARSLGRVGDNVHARRMSERAFAIRHERIHPDRAGSSWSAASHLTDSPNLWAELAALREEPGARLPGPWIAESLRAHEERLQAELERRLTAMAEALHTS